MDTRGRSLIQLLWIATLAVIGVVIVLKVVNGGGERASGDSGGGPVDPAPYRATIEEMEAILYEAAPPAPNDGLRIGSLAHNLGEAVLRREGPQQRSLGLEIIGFAQTVDPDVGYGRMDLAATRRPWEETRARVFRNAPWFRSGDAALTEAQTPPPPAAPTRVVQDLNAAASQFELVLRSARRSVMRMGEVGGTIAVGSPEHRELQRRFEQWNTTFTDDLNTVLRSMPALPPGAESHLIQAHRELEEAVRYVGQIGMSVGGYGVPSIPTRESYFDTAESMLQNARQHLAQVPR